jgi:hypothetical protein
LSLSKSALPSSVSEAARDDSNAPMVIKPWKRSLGHSVTTYLASLMSSDSTSSELEEEGVRGGRPDFESSPEVLIWIRTFRGDVVRSDGRALFRAFADLIELRV